MVSHTPDDRTRPGVNEACTRARAELWPPERIRLAEPEILEARVHVDSCPVCADYLRQDAALLEAYAQLREVRTPFAVRERVFDVLARERAGMDLATRPPSSAEHSGEPRRRGVWFPVGVGVAAGIALLVALLGRSEPTATPLGPAEASAAMVEDYLRRAVGTEQVETSDPREIQRFLAREIGVPMAGLIHPDLIPIRAEVCMLDGTRGALIQYDRDGEVVSHYVIPAEQVGPREPEVAQSMEDGRPDAMGPNVVTWSRPGVQEALVSDLPVAELLELLRTDR
jgi:hypothetical protein